MTAGVELLFLTPVFLYQHGWCEKPVQVRMWEASQVYEDKGLMVCLVQKQKLLVIYNDYNGFLFAVWTEYNLTQIQLKSMTRLPYSVAVV